MGIIRVWKGIFGIRDLTKLWCGIRKNAKYLGETRDLTTPRETGSAKVWVQDAKFFAYLSGIQKSFMTEINVPAAKANQPGTRLVSEWCLLSNQTIECASSIDERPTQANQIFNDNYEFRK